MGYVIPAHVGGWGGIGERCSAVVTIAAAVAGGPSPLKARGYPAKNAGLPRVFLRWEILKMGR